MTLQTYKPYDYQKFAIKQVLKHPAYLLMLDMGLGKTVITLTAIELLAHDYLQIDRVLVIAPSKVANATWPKEIKRWEHLQNLKYAVMTGANAKTRQLALNSKADIYLINPENVPWLYKSIPSDFFDMVVLDDAKGIKTHSSVLFKLLKKIRPKIKRFYILTGTPAPNGLTSLWSQVGLLDGGKRLGKYVTHYLQKYFYPEKSNGHIVYKWKIKSAEAEHEIYSKLADVSISMKATDWLQLPDTIMQTVEVELTTAQSKQYRKFAKEAVLEIAKSTITAANAGVLSNKLLQMANGAVYDEGKEVVHLHNAKLEALLQLIEDANGEPVLVLYWFKHDEQRISAYLQKHGIESRKMQNAKDEDDWNTGKIQVLLGQPGSMGHGLNLQFGGNKTIWFGLTWSLELYQQANARLPRQGQKAKSVFIWHIVTKGTYDEEILPRLFNKDAQQQSLLKAVKVRIKLIKENK